MGRFIVQVFTYVCSFQYQPLLNRSMESSFLQLLPGVLQVLGGAHTPLHSKETGQPQGQNLCEVGLGGSCRSHVRCQVLPDFTGVLMVQINCSE